MLILVIKWCTAAGAYIKAPNHPWMMMVAQSIFSFKPNLNQSNKHKHGWYVLVVQERCAAENVPNAQQKNVKSGYLISVRTHGWYEREMLQQDCVNNAGGMKHEFVYRHVVSFILNQINHSHIRFWHQMYQHREKLWKPSLPYRLFDIRLGHHCWISFNPKKKRKKKRKKKYKTS